MKKLILLVFLALLLTIAANFKVYSQTSASTTAPTPSETVVGKDKTVPFLIEQIKNERRLNAAKDDRIADLETENAVERENSTSLAKSNEALMSENASLKSANESLHAADNLNKQTIALLQADNAKKTEKAKKATKEKWKAYGVAAVTLAITYLLH